jgi:hypothetical protein
VFQEEKQTMDPYQYQHLDQSPYSSTDYSSFQQPFQPPAPLERYDMPTLMATPSEDGSGKKTKVVIFVLMVFITISVAVFVLYRKFKAKQDADKKATMATTAAPAPTTAPAPAPAAKTTSTTPPSSSTPPTSSSGTITDTKKSITTTTSSDGKTAGTDQSSATTKKPDASPAVTTTTTSLPPPPPVSTIPSSSTTTQPTSSVPQPRPPSFTDRNMTISCYSLAQVNPDSQFAIQVRNGRTNETKDIGFLSDGKLNLNSLTSFLSGADGFVTIFYDQTANQNHLIQPNSSLQGKIVENGHPILVDSKLCIRIGPNQRMITSKKITWGNTPTLLTALSMSREPSRTEAIFAHENNSSGYFDFTYNPSQHIIEVNNAGNAVFCKANMNNPSQMSFYGVSIQDERSFVYKSENINGEQTNLLVSSSEPGRFTSEPSNYILGNNPLWASSNHDLEINVSFLYMLSNKLSDQEIKSGITELKQKSSRIIVRKIKTQ